MSHCGENIHPAVRVTQNADNLKPDFRGLTSDVLCLAKCYLGSTPSRRKRGDRLSGKLWNAPRTVPEVQDIYNGCRFITHVEDQKRLQRHLPNPAPFVVERKPLRHRGQTQCTGDKFLT